MIQSCNQTCSSKKYHLIAFSALCYCIDSVLNWRFVGTHSNIFAPDYLFPTEPWRVFVIFTDLLETDHSLFQHMNNGTCFFHRRIKSTVLWKVGYSQYKTKIGSGMILKIARCSGYIPLLMAKSVHLLS